MNYKKLALIGVGLFLTSLVASVVTPFIHPAEAAPASYQWYSTRVIKVDNKDYTYIKNIKNEICTRISCTQTYVAVFAESDPHAVDCKIDPNASAKNDAGVTYKASDFNFNGGSAIALATGSDQYQPDGKDKVSGVAYYVSYTKSTGGPDVGACRMDNPIRITIADASAATTRFFWQDNSTIIDVSNGWIYKNSDPATPDIFYKKPPNSGTCASYMKLQGGNKEIGDYFALLNAPEKDYEKIPSTNCYKKQTGTYTIGALEKSTLPGDPSGPGNTGTCSTDTTDNDICTNSDDATLDCGAAGWNWLICTGINMLQGGLETLDSLIMDQLNHSTDDSFHGAKGVAYKKVWTVFRNIAIALLLITALIMVLSQALGFEMLNAYTIRRTAPRLLIAAVGISILWPLLEFVTNFFNTLGYDVRGLVYGPFKDMAASGGTGTFVLIGNPFTLFAAGTIMVALYGPAIFTFLITAFLFALGAVAGLVFRGAMLDVLVMVAPLAVGAWALQGDSKGTAGIPNLGKFWFENWFGLLGFFPAWAFVVAALHGISAVMKNGGFFSQIGALVLYVLPYALLLPMLRKAPGFVSTATNGMENFTKGMRERLAKGRAQTVATNVNKMKEGTRFSERNALTRGFNRATVAAGTGWEGRFGTTERGRQAIDQRRRMAAQNSIMKDPKWATIQENDDTLHALTHDGPAQARAALMRRWGGDAARVDRAIASAQTSVGFGRAQAIAAAQQLAATGTGYTDMADQSLTIARASGGNETTAAAIGGFNNFINKQKGRHDLAPGAGAVITAAQGTMHAAAQGGEAQAEAYAQQQQQANMVAAWNSGGLYDHGRAKGANMEAFATYWQTELQQALTSPVGTAGREERLQAALTARMELQAILPNSSGDVQVRINRALANMDQAEVQYRQDNMFSGVGPRTMEQQAAQDSYSRAADSARREARVYERPDPSRLTDA